MSFTAPSDIAAIPVAPALRRPRLWVRPSMRGEGGFHHLLSVAAPMVMSSLVGSINLYFDRLFVAKYDLENHFGACLPAGFTWWMTQSILVGLVGYVSTFVAQYIGADRPGRVGAALWQGIYLAIGGGVLMLGLIPLAPIGFKAIGHAGDLPRLETLYFSILCWGSVFMHINNAMSCFYSGRGKTMIVLGVNGVVALSNIFLDWWLVLDPWPEAFPAPSFIHRGVEGAAVATVLSFVLGTVLLAIGVFSRANERQFQTRASWRVEKGLLARMIRFGLPSGFHFLVDMAAFWIFLMTVGRLGGRELTSTNIAFNINALLFIPMVGLHQGVSVLVGQFIGAKDIHKAEKVTALSMALCLGYMTLNGVLYIFFPDFLIDPFIATATAGEKAAVAELTRRLLVFVAFYSLFDAVGLVYSGALKGAGDTRFVMYMSAVFSWFLLSIPCILVVKYGLGVYASWAFVTLYIIFLAAVFLGRYWAGHWRAMSVIETKVVGMTRDDVPLAGVVPGEAGPA